MKAMLAENESLIWSGRASLRTGALWYIGSIIGAMKISPILLILLPSAFLGMLTSRYQFTNVRVRFRVGIGHTQVLKEIPLERIESVAVLRTPVDSILKIGRIVITPESGWKPIVFRGLLDAERVKMLLDKAIDEYTEVV